jgi:mannose-6-phosphate isomerase
VRAVQKPWGTLDLLPWSRLTTDAGPVGELWFDRAEGEGGAPELLIKLLFTEQRLSIQVHPDDSYARSIGQANGKTEAWYILSARDGAQVGVGLSSSLSASELRAAILDGSVADLVDWRTVAAGDLVFVPAGTIHAIGPGLVIAEIQQRSDTTFRLFDYGRDRPLDVERAIAVADAGPADPQHQPDRLNANRTILLANALFIIDRITLAPSVPYQFTATGETWIMAVAGSLTVGGIDLDPGQVAYMDYGGAELTPGPAGAVALVACSGPHIAPGAAKEPAHLEALV